MKIYQLAKKKQYLTPEERGSSLSQLSAAPEEQLKSAGVFMAGLIVAGLNWYKRAQKMNIDHVAKIVRAHMVRCYDDKCLRERCLPASRQLKKELILNGYDATVTQGAFTVDNPDPVAVGKMDTKGLTEEDVEDAKYHPSHYWVEVGNLIIDITASQFNSELDEPVKDIQIGTYDQLERYTPIHKNYNELV